jgi:hypothetical protein
LSLLFMLTACASATPTIDPSVKITEIASTVLAELTNVSALTPVATQTFTPTVTATIVVSTPTSSLPSASPTSTGQATTNSGDNAKWDKDITIPDGSLIKPGTTFEKTWSVLNDGTTTWTKDYQLMYVDGTQTPTLMVKLNKDVKPGELTQITIKFVAPTALGTYSSYWKMYNTSGFVFGEPLSIHFTVGNETATPTSNVPSVTPTITVTPVVTAAP